MSTATESQVQASTAAHHDLAHYLGASMKPGAKLAVKLHVWPAWPSVGEFECKRLGHDSIEFRVDVQVARLPPLRLDGALRLGPMGRCVVTLGGITDSDASYRRSGERLLVESKSFGNFKPSIEFWPAGEETKADVFVNLGPIRPKFHVAITPSMSAMAEEWEQAIAAFGES